MIKRIEQFFRQLSASNASEDCSPQQIHLATAALLVEVATIHQNFLESERQQLQTSLCDQCQLSAEEAAELIAEARQASAESASLHEFTRQINQCFEYEDKLQLVRNLWEVAWADGNLDKYEEHIIRRITDLIHVSHRDFIQMKIQVRDGSSR